MAATQAEPFDETTGSLARKAKCLPETVRYYADLGLVPCIRLPNGMRMFQSSARGRVLEVLAARLKNRGGRRGT